MTVTYSAEVATSRGFGCFWKLLFRWRGSIYKLLWPDLGLYVFLYYSLSITYRFLLGDSQRRYFEKVSLYCKVYGDLIPVSFILGFYVSIVVKRWWDCFNCIPWPDTLAFFVSAYVHGQDERGRLMRRGIMRYVNLAFVITLTCISPCVKKRFPTMDHLVEAGILLPNEKKIMEHLKTSHSTYWMPLVWASSIAIRARKEGRIRDDFALNTLVEAIANYRSLCGGLYNYDWISIPLVYTQVVTLVVYTYFLSTLMGRQYLDPDQGYPGYDVDLYVPVFNFLQFFFYMGWLKVAETLVNPFGEDDDDFEVNWVIDRDIQVSYLIVDEMHQEHPELLKDQYWDEVLPDLPYTAAAMPFYTEPPMGSAANLIIPPHEAEFVPLETVIEDDDELEGVKVNGIPCEGTKASSFLSHNLSGSSYSGLSKLGQSFHPMSYEKKGIFSMMQDLFSRESSVRRKKRIWKAPSKSTIDPSLSCDTSGPPTPEELKTQRDFNDDIFRLSDLSLADSRGTGIAQSPGIFGNLQIADFFGRLRSDRSSHRSSGRVSTPGAHTPCSEAPGDEHVRTPGILKKQKAGSLKQFFHSERYHGSEKSLIDPVHLNSGPSTQLADEDSKYLKYNPDNEVDTEKGREVSPANSDEDITVLESLPNFKKEKYLNTGVTDHQTSEPISFKGSPRDACKVIHASSDDLGKMAKEPSTSTLVPVNGSLEDTPPFTKEKLTDSDVDLLTDSNAFCMTDKDSKLNQSHIDSLVNAEVKPNLNLPISAPENEHMKLESPTVILPATEEVKRIANPQVQVWAAETSSSPKPSPKLSRLPPVTVPKSNSKGMFSRLRPKRAISLHINTLHDTETSSLSGVRRFRERRAPFFRTISQPVSPTESLALSRGGLFGRRPSRAFSGFFSRRSSRGDAMPDSTDSHHNLVLEKNIKNSNKSSDV